MQPPQSPFNQPNYGQGAPYGAPAPQTPRGTVSLDVIGEAWKLVSANMGTWIAATAIYLVVGLIFNGLERATQTHGPSGLPQNTPFSFLILGFSIFITQFLVGGLMRMALTTVKGGKAEISEMFTAGDVLMSLVIAAIITGIAIGVGIVLCIIPGLIVASGLALVTPIIVDKRQGAIAALGESWGAMTPNLMMGIILGIVLLLIIFVSALPCGLGLLVTIPLAQVSIALVYRDLFGIGTGAPQQTGYTPPPIANPNF